MISMRFAGSCFLSFSVFSLDIFAKEEYSILVRYLWARGSAGRAPRSQRGGRGFEPLRVHHYGKNRDLFPAFFRSVNPGEGVRSRRAAPGAEQSGGLWSRRWLI